MEQRLFDEFSKDIIKGTVTGFAQFYQKFLANGPSVYQEQYQLGPTLEGRLSQPPTTDKEAREQLEKSLNS